MGERARIKCVCVVGGMPKGPQRLSLKEEGVACVIGTPGRLMDLALLAERCCLVLAKVTNADVCGRMLTNADVCCWLSAAALSWLR